MSALKKLVIISLAFCFLLALIWWFLADEALDPATQAWLEDGYESPHSEGLDYLLFMGLMAPANENPIEYARHTARQMDAGTDVQVDYLPELMRNSPCDIDDWDCWKRDDSQWVASTLESNDHALNRWYSLPVHHDFGEEPLSWLFGLGVPAVESLQHLQTLQLVDAKRRQDLDQLALKAVEHAARMAEARPMDGNILSLVLFEAIRQTSLNQMMEAIRLGAVPPPQEDIEELFANQISVEDHLIVWSHREFQKFSNLRPSFHRQFPNFLLARENRTLNRARACLEQAVPLSEPTLLFEFMEAESEICDPDWKSWRNWRGDDLIDLYFWGLESSACRVHGAAQRELLANATLVALVANHSESQRLAAVGRANPFHPYLGAILKGEEICFEALAPTCGEACLPAPWRVDSVAEE